MVFCDGLRRVSCCKACRPTKVAAAAVEKVLTEAEVSSWQTSFDNLLRSPEGQRHFSTYLKTEYSDENILFYQACQELKREQNPEKIEEKARIIYEDFVSILSPKEVSLDAKVREMINDRMSNPTVDLFDPAQEQIYLLMQRDSYPRFVCSNVFSSIQARVSGRKTDTISTEPQPEQAQPQQQQQ